MSHGKSLPQASRLGLPSVHRQRSFEQITLKLSATIYEPGTPVVAEYAAGVATGLYVRVTDAILVGDDPITAAIVNCRTNAVAANTPALVTARDAEVKGSELELVAGVTVAEVTPTLAARGIIVR